MIIYRLKISYRPNEDFYFNKIPTKQQVFDAINTFKEYCIANEEPGFAFNWLVEVELNDFEKQAVNICNLEKGWKDIFVKELE